MRTLVDRARKADRMSRGRKTSAKAAKPASAVLRSRSTGKRSKTALSQRGPKRGE